jgi:hypothetical protein
MDTSKSIVQLQENELLHQVLIQYAIEGSELSISRFGTGLINRTWKVTGHPNNKNYILQKINTSVFTNPKAIAENIASIGNYLAANAPDYFFVTPLPTQDGSFMVHHDNGDWYRLMPFVENTITFDTVDKPEQAYEAAWAFGKFAAALKIFPPTGCTLPCPIFIISTSGIISIARPCTKALKIQRLRLPKKLKRLLCTFPFKANMRKLPPM